MSVLFCMETWVVRRYCRYLSRQTTTCHMVKNRAMTKAKTIIMTKIIINRIAMQ